MMLICYVCPTNHYHTTTVLRPFFRDHPSKPVPEDNFWTLWCKGRLTEADTPTIRLGATPSGLTSAYLHHPPHFFIGQMPFLPPNQQCQSTECTVLNRNILESCTAVLYTELILSQHQGNHSVYTVGWASGRASACKNGVMRCWYDCLSGRGANDCIWSGWCNCHPVVSCFIKIQIALTFLALAYPGYSGNRDVLEPAKIWVRRYLSLCKIWLESMQWFQ